MCFSLCGLKKQFPRTRRKLINFFIMNINNYVVTVLVIMKIWLTFCVIGQSVKKTKWLILLRVQERVTILTIDTVPLSQDPLPRSDSQISVRIDDEDAPSALSETVTASDTTLGSPPPAEEEKEGGRPKAFTAVGVVGKYSRNCCEDIQRRMNTSYNFSNMFQMCVLYLFVSEWASKDIPA